jgi:hypothetical protein
MKRILTMLLCVVCAACSNPTYEGDYVLNPPPGYMSNYSEGMMRNPPASEIHAYHEAVWKGVNAISRRETAQMQQQYYFSGGKTPFNDQFSGFKTHTLRVRFSISSTGEVAILAVEHPADTPKRQIDYVKKAVLKIRKEPPPFPKTMSEAGQTSVEDTLVFKFT